MTARKQSHPDRSDALFKEVKAKANGMLAPAVYRAVYEFAAAAPEGAFVEIGPAQGGSTVALAMACQDRPYKERVQSFDTFRDSKSLQSWDDVEANAAVVRSNLRAFGVEKWANVYVVDSPDTVENTVDGKPISLLFIDADGALDRDFATLYDKLVDGARVIIDDYDEKISTKYVDYSDSALAKYVKGKGLETIEMGCPLGKHHTTFRLMNAFVEQGLFAIHSVERNTLLAYKTGTKAYAESGAPEAAKRARDDILKQFMDQRASKAAA